MVDILNIKNDIVKVSFFLNIVFFVIAIFESSKALIITASVINLILLGTFILINKYFTMFTENANMFGNLGTTLDRLTNVGKN